MNKKRLILLIGALVVLLVVIGLFYGSREKYPQIEDQEDYTEVMAMETAYLYFGRDSCPYCRKFQPLLDEAIAQTGVTVYQYDTDAHAKDEDYQQILSAHEVETVPKLVKLENGETVDFVDHTSSQEEITALLSGEE